MGKQCHQAGSEQPLPPNGGMLETVAWLLAGAFCTAFWLGVIALLV